MHMSGKAFETTKFNHIADEINSKLVRIRRTPLSADAQSHHNLLTRHHVLHAQCWHSPSLTQLHRAQLSMKGGLNW